VVLVNADFRRTVAIVAGNLSEETQTLQDCLDACGKARLGAGSLMAHYSGFASPWFHLGASSPEFWTRRKENRLPLFAQPNGEESERPVQRLVCTSIDA
jgi:hypothetical protein